MEFIAGIAREAVIILAVVALVAGGGYGLLKFRRSIGGGIDDHLRLSDSDKINRIKKWALTITGVLWILVFVILSDGEDRGRFTDAVKGFFGFVSEEAKSVMPKEEKKKMENLPQIPAR